jgi:hypothetical protein
MEQRTEDEARFGESSYHTRPTAYNLVLQEYLLLTNNGHVEELGMYVGLCELWNGREHEAGKKEGRQGRASHAKSSGQEFSVIAGGS